MKKLFEIVRERNQKETDLATMIKVFNRDKKILEDEISELKRLESIGGDGLKIEDVQLAETIIRVSGNPWAQTDDVARRKAKTIAEKAIIDIANGCPHLKREYYGNKQYDGFYQEAGCEYGYGPRHGSIVDRIELKIFNRELKDIERDAAIYYLMNYQKIMEAKKKLATV